MKKIIVFLIAAVMCATLAHGQTTTVTKSYSANEDVGTYLAVKDTLTNTDTTIYLVTLAGARANVTFQCNVLKLTGTVAGKFDIYGSVDGVNYVTAIAATSVTKTDASVNYQINFTSNQYKIYKVLSISSGTNTHSERVYLLSRMAK